MGFTVNRIARETIIRFFCNSIRMRLIASVNRFGRKRRTISDRMGARRGTSFIRETRISECRISIEYDPFTRCWLAAVYVGKKSDFPNYPLFFIDGTVAPVEGELRDRCGERGLLLTLAKGSEEQNGITGCRFPWGQTGVWARGNGTYWFSQHTYDKEHHLNSTTLVGFCYDPTNINCFREL